jgi:hypothetical protein
MRERLPLIKRLIEEAPPGVASQDLVRAAPVRLRCNAAVSSKCGGCMLQRSATHLRRRVTRQRHTLQHSAERYYTAQHAATQRSM